MSNIQVYDPLNTNFDKNGNVFLTPISGKVRQVAAGSYELDLVHPLDPEGKWQHLVPEAVIRAPVPTEIIESAMSGLEADVYKTTEAAAMRESPSEPQTITYQQWIAGGDYSVGSKVTYNSHNYKCNTWDSSSGQIMVPPNNNPWWTEIARKTSGAPILVNLKQGAEVYFVEDVGSGWYKMSMPYGLEGYIKSSQLTFYRHLTPSETQPREVKTQLFRIKNVNVETKENTITVKAVHVSYDLGGVLIKSVSIKRKSAAFALAQIEDGFMIDYAGTIATNLTETTNTDYSADISGKSGLFALLDPDSGVVSCFDAEFHRDNWDLFVMNKVYDDRGFRIQYGNNMIGVSWGQDSDNLCNRIVPVAKAADGSDFYLEGNGWVDSPDIAQQPVIRMERIRVNGQVGKDDGTGTGTDWTETTLRAEMTRQANAKFTVDKIDQVAHDITVDFERLGDTAEYAGLKDLQKVMLYDLVKAINMRIGLMADLYVSEVEFDIIKEKISALVLTNIRVYGVRSIGGFNVINNTITGDKLTDECGDALTDRAVYQAGQYTDQAKSQAISTSESYTRSKISSYDTEIKRYMQEHYQPL